MYMYINVYTHTHTHTELRPLTFIEKLHGDGLVCLNLCLVRIQLQIVSTQHLYNDVIHTCTCTCTIMYIHSVYVCIIIHAHMYVYIEKTNEKGRGEVCTLTRDRVGRCQADLKYPEAILKGELPLEVQQ